MMDFLSTALNYTTVALVFVLMISVLVAAHELGHYLFARLFGMGVEEFAIGFGKRPIWIWMQKTYKVVDEHHPDVEATETTDFTVRPWPLGGFVRIKGMVPEDDGSEVDIPGGFYNKAPWQRFIVLLAGPAFSVIAGILVLWPLYATIGIERYVGVPVVEKIMPDGPAMTSDIKEGDKIVAINGQPVDSFYKLQAVLRPLGEKKVLVGVERGAEKLQIPITPVWSDMDSMVMDEKGDATGEFARQAVLGVTINRGKDILVRLAPKDALVAALYTPVTAVRNIVSLIKSPKNFQRSVSGPATMVAYTKYALDKGIATVLKLAALLSISVGIFNLLPFAPLDGGQMVVAVLETFRRGKRLSIEMQTKLGAVGMSLIVVLVLFAWFFDFKRWVMPEKESGMPKLSKQK
ncbi:MAG: RIP metalloprotease [Fimbriimonas sp.]